jgi:hypothetical protein
VQGCLCHILLLLFTKKSRPYRNTGGFPKSINQTYEKTYDQTRR